jgi:DNA-binding MarR family transcriptional regulator/GNAT superfamily N-acetyltransferase
MRRESLTKVRDMSMVEQVRAFNRTVTQGVGALNDRYLARDRSLGESRVLWEIGAAGEAGADIRALRARLGLDSGYLSRLLRSLEGAGLVAVGPSETDRRVRTVRLTRRGGREWRVLDERSNELAESLLAPLSPSQRTRLVEAMATVEHLLTAALVRLDVVDPASDAARFCLTSYYVELGERFETGFDPAVTLPALDVEMREPAGLFLVAFRFGEPVGCGALKFHGREPTEIKRLWVSPSARGLGLGRRLLDQLERLAADHGSKVVRLDTNRTLVEAIAMYRTAGYHEIDRFNDEPYAHHWFEKRLR